MASTFTPNIQWEEPARGDDVGTWDTPVNNNGTLIDLVTGGTATQALNNANVTLSAAQFRCKTLTFNSTLTGSVVITFPTSFTKSYEILNQCTGSSANTITLATTVAGSQVVCAPPGEIVDVVNVGGNMVYKNLGRIGSYWDYGGSSVPNWVQGCTIPPYVNCDATTFSSATYPVLTVILGGTTLPDRRGTVGVTLNQGTGRTVNVVNASSVGVVGGADIITLATSQIPAHNHTLTDPGHTHTYQGNTGPGVFNPTIQSEANGNNTLSGAINSATTGITIASAGGGGSHGNVQPTTVYGICMIRAG